MSSEKISDEVEKAIGNTNIEGIDVPDEEKDLIKRVVQKHQEHLDDKAVESLLYDLVMKAKAKEEDNAKKR